MTYVDAILAALARSGRSGRDVSIAAVGHESAIRSIKRGMDVRVSTLEALCGELGLEFYVGPRRAERTRDGYEATIRERDPAPQWVAQLTDDLRSEIRHLLAREPSIGRRVRLAAEDESLSADVVWSPEPVEIAGTRWVDCYEVRSAAQDGALLDDSTRVGYLAFRRRWLSRHRLDASQCAVVRVQGESMDPTLNDGSTILVSLGQRRRHSGRIYAIRTDDGLIVRRLDRAPGGHWQLISDHPPRESRPWPNGAEILGQVRWGTMTFP